MTAGTTGKYHIFKRKIKETGTGKAIKAWYYWFDDESGARIRRSCGEAKQPVLLQREAEARIEHIEVEEKKRQAKAVETISAARAVRFKDIAAKMYLADGKHMKLRTERGEALTDTTMEECRGYLDNHIVPKWGAYLPADISGAEIEDWLMEKDRSNSWRNRCFEVMAEVFSECVRYKVIPRAPEMKRFHRKKSKQGTLTDKEIAMLFPECPGALDCIWRQSDAREGRYGGLMFGALFALILSTGMRSGEGRAVRREQIDRKRFGLIIDQSVDSKNRIVGHLKKGGEDDPRLRVAIIPARAMKILDWWLKVAPPIPSDLIFSYRGETITKEHLGARFALGLDRAGIDKEGRKLTPHALRYTYNTRMARLIPGEPLRLMIGHRDEAMTDQYTRVELENQLVSLQEHRPAIERFWG
jgi:integrase